MKEKECKPLSEEFLKQFLLEAQHHSGLPLINPLSMYYVQILSRADFSEDLLPNLMEKLISKYMINVYEIHKQTKNWKSYDW